MTNSHFLWIEKYRPDTLANYIGNEALKAKFETYIADQNIPHLFLFGPAGTGKTTAAKILLRSIDADTMVLNASDENNIDTVRNKIRGFAATRGFKPLKIMLLDEFDGFTQQGQGALRNLMEQFSLTTRFILTANYVERIIPQITSRTQQFEIVPPSRKDVAIHLAKILKLEGVEYQPADVKLLIDAHFPDIRKILGEAQLHARDGVLRIATTELIESDFKLKIVEILKNKQSTIDKFKGIRQIVNNAQLRDFTDVFRLLFENVDEYSTNISASIVAIAEGARWDSLVVDKELNFMSTIKTLLDTL